MNQPPQDQPGWASPEGGTPANRSQPEHYPEWMTAEPADSGQQGQHEQPEKSAAPTLRSWQRTAPDAPAIPVPEHTPAVPQPPSGQSPYGVRPEPTPAAPGQNQFHFPQLRKPKLEPRAVAGLAASVLGLPGIILGGLALPRVRGGKRRSPNLAWSAIVLGGIFTIGWVLVAVTLVLNGTYDRWTEEPEAGDVSEPRTIASANLAEGNCIATLPPRGPVGDVRLVPCATAHIAQVITVHDQDGDFPGEEELDATAESTCTADVEALGDTEAAVGPYWLTPTEAGWNQGNTRIICMARGTAGSFEGDLIG